jgi:hypothetical protein
MAVKTYPMVSAETRTYTVITSISATVRAATLSGSRPFQRLENSLKGSATGTDSEVMKVACVVAVNVIFPTPIRRTGTKPNRICATVGRRTSRKK